MNDPINSREAPSFDIEHDINEYIDNIDVRVIGVQSSAAATAAAAAHKINMLRDPLENITSSTPYQQYSEIDPYPYPYLDDNSVTN